MSSEGPSVNKIETAIAKFEELIDIARSTVGSSTDYGMLSHADFDELRMLAKYLRARLPDTVHELIDRQFPQSAPEQREFGERVQRALDFSSSFGNLETAELNPELLPRFSLGQKDKERVLKLCVDMRKIVFASPDFDEPHKKRLLNRIAAIEKQVLSPEGLFDVVLGGMSDVGETLGKFGKDIKPLTDRMAEVARITRKGSKAYDQIPAPEEIKKLPPPGVEKHE